MPTACWSSRCGPRNSFSVHEWPSSAASPPVRPPIAPSARVEHRARRPWTTPPPAHPVARILSTRRSTARRLTLLRAEGRGAKLRRRDGQRRQPSGARVPCDAGSEADDLYRVLYGEAGSTTTHLGGSGRAGIDLAFACGSRDEDHRTVVESNLRHESVVL